jgi:hypothetical protein
VQETPSCNVNQIWFDAYFILLIGSLFTELYEAVAYPISTFFSFNHNLCFQIVI